MINKYGGKCSVCMYDKYMAALCFHHIDSSNKSFSIASNWGLSLKKLKKELEKCVLLCANCHNAYHAGELSLS